MTPREPLGSSSQGPAPALHCDCVVGGGSIQGSCGLGRGRGGDGRLLGPQPRPGQESGSNGTWWLVHPGSSWEGASSGGGGCHFPRGQEAAVSLERTGFFLGPLSGVTYDKDSGHFPAAQGWKGSGAPGVPGDSHPGEKWDGVSSGENHLPTLPPVTPTLPYRDRAASAPPAAWDPRKTAGSLGVAMSANSHTGRGSRNGYTRTKIKDPKLLGKARTCLELLPVPEERQDRALQGTECQEHFQTHTASVPPKYR